MKDYIVYLLLDPRIAYNFSLTLNGYKKKIKYYVLYVGKSTDLSNRYKRHISDARNPKNEKDNYINEMLEEGYKPILVPLLKTSNENNARRWERYITSYLKNDRGFDLLNKDVTPTTFFKDSLIKHDKSVIVKFVMNQPTKLIKVSKKVTISSVDKNPFLVV